MSQPKDLGFLFVFSDPQGSEITDEEYHDWYDNVCTFLQESLIRIGTSTSPSFDPRLPLRRPLQGK
jgi:hypothetical protein